MIPRCAIKASSVAAGIGGAAIIIVAAYGFRGTGNITSSARRGGIGGGTGLTVAAASPRTKSSANRVDRRFRIATSSVTSTFLAQTIPIISTGAVLGFAECAFIASVGDTAAYAVYRRSRYRLAAAVIRAVAAAVAVP